MARLGVVLCKFGQLCWTRQIFKHQNHVSGLCIGLSDDTIKTLVYMCKCVYIGMYAYTYVYVFMRVCM